MRLPKYEIEQINYEFTINEILELLTYVARGIYDNPSNDILKFDLDGNGIVDMDDCQNVLERYMQGPVSKRTEREMAMFRQHMHELYTGKIFPNKKAALPIVEEWKKLGSIYSAGEYNPDEATKPFKTMYTKKSQTKDLNINEVKNPNE